MRKIALFLLLVVVFVFGSSQDAFAATVSCNLRGIPSGFNTIISDFNNGAQHTVSFDMSNYPNGKYVLVADTSGGQTGFQTVSASFNLGESGSFSNATGEITINGSVVTWKITDENALSSLLLGDKKNFIKVYENSALFSNYVCTAGSFTVKKGVSGESGPACDVYVWQVRGGQECYASGSSGCLLGGNVTTHIEAQGIKNANGSPYNGSVYFTLGIGQAHPVNVSNGTGSMEFKTSKIGTYTLKITKISSGSDITSPSTLGSGETRPPGTPLCASKSFQTSSDCGENACAPRGVVSQSQTEANFELCSQTTANSSRDRCISCLAGETLNGEQGIWTAIGCIPTAPTGIIQTLIRLALGLGGGVTLLLILAGAFRLSVSQGDPKAAEEAKEQITSAVIGLLFIIFSVVMLRFIGIQVLQIPGFGG